MPRRTTRPRGRPIWAGEAETVKDAIHAAIVSRANLSWANLSGANLSGADLSGADGYAPTMVLLASCGNVSPELCTLLMRFDAANHPDGVAAFQAWADGGLCPYNGVRVARVAQFIEVESLWSADAPVLSAYELMVRLIREKCANSDYHDKAVQ